MHLHTPPDLRAQAQTAGANCGPGAIAAATGLTVSEVMDALAAADHGWPGYTTYRAALKAVARLGLRTQSTPNRPAGGRPGVRLPGHGLVLLQFTGPWTQPGVPSAAARKHTHWVAVRCEQDDAGGGVRTIWIYDVNAVDGGGWLAAADWKKEVLPRLLAAHPRAEGCFNSRAFDVFPPQSSDDSADGPRTSIAPQRQEPRPAPSLAQACHHPVKDPPNLRGAVVDLVGRLHHTLTGHRIKLLRPPSADEADVGPRWVRVYVRLKPGQSIRGIQKISADIAREVGTTTADICVTNLPERHAVGVDLPIRSLGYSVTYDELRSHPSFAAAGAELALGICLGIDVTGRPRWMDLAAMPHLLVAGTTGSGKTVFLRTLLLTLILNTSADDLELELASSKPMDFRVFSDAPQFSGKIAQDPDDIQAMVIDLVEEMNRRIALIDRARHDDIANYNADPQTKEKLPRIVAVIDEYGETVLALARSERRAFESSVGRLAQKARAAGIHLILSMQRPDRTVLQGIIKANVLHRVALKLPQSADSRIVLDCGGAESLLGKGDLLYLDAEGRLERLQVPFLEGGG